MDSLVDIASLAQISAPTSSESLTDETFIPLSRGLLGHLPGFPPAALIVWLFLLLKAAYQDESLLDLRKGECRASVQQIAAGTGLSTATAARAVQQLQPKYVQKVGRAKYRVRKYKTISDFRKPLGDVSNLDESGDPDDEEAVQFELNLRQNVSSVAQTRPSRLSYRKRIRGATKRASHNRRVRRSPESPTDSAPADAPGFTCSHGDCPHHSWHCARIVAELQGCQFPDAERGLPADRKVRGRWLAGTTVLAGYSDAAIEAFVGSKLARESAWGTRVLFPSFVADDISKAGAADPDAGIPPLATAKHDEQVGGVA